VPPPDTGEITLATPLAHAQIAALVTAADVETVVQTGSTNSDLLGRVRAEAPRRPILRTALEQTAGRGRHGRAWHAAPGSALLLSLAIPLEAPRAIDGAVSLACGLAAAEALAPRAAVKLKWPNDLFLDGRKLGGVLCELALDGAGRRTLVAGIGINLTLAPEVRAAIGQPAASLDEVMPLVELLALREVMIGRIAESVVALVKEFDRHGFAPLRARFLARFALLGREVELVEAKRLIAGGIAVDIDDAGRLLVRTAAGTRAFAGGEVSLRMAPRGA
jgi:BirA family biotin operon repressor/biotin-[acetyl-CoA-carboxylase] ligase